MPKCKCGKPCAYYGPIGDYSVACTGCNARNAERNRVGRAKRKRLRRSHVLQSM